MSTPKNHHYVSQCQIRNFFNNEDGKIYLYDKTIDNIFSKTTTKTVFSERELNTIYEDGKIDHESIENDLKKHFEESFNTNVSIAKNYVDTQQADKKQIQNALIELTKLAIIGNMRTPTERKRLDSILLNTFEPIMKAASPELRASYEQFINERKELKYLNNLIYSNVAEEIFNRMAPVSSVLYVIMTDDYFVLPDCSSLIIRKRIIEHFNPDVEDIADVGIPLSSKLFLQSVSAKTGIKTGGIFYLGEDYINFIYEMNKMSLAVSKKMIACENVDYLKNFINNAKEDFKNKGFDISKEFNLG